MNQQSRLSRTHLQGVVNNVFDVAEKYGVIPEPEDFLAGIRVWLEEGLLIRTLPGIDNKRLPVPEINASEHILILHTLDNVINDKRKLCRYWWNPKFRKYIKKNKEKLAEEITNEIRKRKASQSRNKVLHILTKILDKYEKEIK